MNEDYLQKIMTSVAFILLSNALVFFWNSDAAQLFDHNISTRPIYPKDKLKVDTTIYPKSGDSLYIFSKVIDGKVITLESPELIIME